MNNTTEKLGLRILELNEKLQAETQRADKAEEMVASLASLLKYHSIDGTAPGYLQSIMKSYDVSNLETAAPVLQAYRQKLCDEIVGKIEADVDYTIKVAQTGSDEFKSISEGKVFAFNIAKDIVKSVLSEEVP